MERAEYAGARNLPDRLGQLRLGLLRPLGAEQALGLAGEVPGRPLRGHARRRPAVRRDLERALAHLRREGRDSLLRRGQALGRHRMRREHPLDRPRLFRLHREQRPVSLDHAARGVTGRDRVREAELVALPLLLARVVGHHELSADHRAERDQLPVLDVGGLHVESAAHQDGSGQHLAVVGRDRVAGGDVADLVTEHCGHAVLGFHAREQPPRDANLAPGERKRVDLGIVHRGELVRQGRPVANRRKRAADPRDGPLQLAVLDRAERALDGARVVRLPHLDLLRLAEEIELRLSCHRVNGAAGGRDRQQQTARANVSPVHFRLPASLQIMIAEPSEA